MSFVMKDTLSANSLGALVRCTGVTIANNGQLVK